MPIEVVKAPEIDTQGLTEEVERLRIELLKERVKAELFEKLYKEAIA